MTRFVFITQVVDPDHPALGATVAKIRAVSERVDQVVVLALEGIPDALPGNCRLLTFGAGSRPVRVARFVAAMSKVCRRPEPAVVLAHMAPEYAVLAAPWCRARRIPLLLWYTHWHRTRMLQAALSLADAVVSVDRSSFPIDSQKVHGIGHGIDVDAFTCGDTPRPARGLRLLSLGRYSESKGLDTVIRAVAMSPATTLVHHGPTLTPQEVAHRQELERLVDALGAQEQVTLADAIPRSEVPAAFSSVDALVNNMRAGAPDKVVFEAAASCLPVFASNPSFDELLPPTLRFRRDDAAELSARLAAFERDGSAEVGRSLRARVSADHSCDHWAAMVLLVALEHHGAEPLR